MEVSIEEAIEGNSLLQTPNRKENNKVGRVNAIKTRKNT